VSVKDKDFSVSVILGWVEEAFDLALKAVYVI